LVEIGCDRIVRLDNVDLHLVEAGRAGQPPVLLLHGFPEFWWAWRNQIPSLAEAGLHVAAMDMRGYGRSDTPSGVKSVQLEALVGDVVALLEKMGWARIRVVGHDWGGIVAWTLAARYPHLVDRLVIVNAPHLDVMPEVLLRRPGQILRSSYIGFFQLPLVPEAVLSAGRHKLLRHALVSTSRAGTFSPEDLDRYAAEWARPGRLNTMINYYRALLRYPQKRLGKISVQTLILWGRRDHALDEFLADASLLQCDNGVVRYHDHATHWIHLEEPAWVSEKLIEFLQPDRMKAS